jgi:EAL domain-containing protein (putative c-di-GMP-specific phosphodiesterase class I)
VRDAPRPVALSINLHTQSLGDPGLAVYITAKVVEFNIDPTLLTFEITESHAIEDLASAQRVLHQLRELGCRIAVDDFGTGFSTFAYLRQLEADIVKIDGSLIQRLPDDPIDRTVVAALASIAEAAGERTLAECVENPISLLALYECGVDMAQGNAVGQPRMHLQTTPPMVAARDGRVGDLQQPPEVAAG